MAFSDIREQVDLIREVFAYTERFRGSTFVIKISNRIIDHPNFSQHVRDLVLLHKAGIRTVLVPGARNRIDEILKHFDVEDHFEQGIRISDPHSIELVKMAAFDMAHRMMTALSRHQITAVTANWVRARSIGVINGIDYMRTGIVDRIGVEAVMRSLDQGHLPIFPCVGHNESGDPFNLSSDELAVSIAVQLNASKIFHLEESPVINTADWTIPGDIDVLADGRVSRLTPDGVEKVLNLNPDIPGRDVLVATAEACRQGIERCHILDGRQSGVLLKEIFSNMGVGTMVFSDAYERLRPMEPSDIPGILEIIDPLIAEGILVKRNREELENSYKDYWVYAMDGVVHGCAALHHRGDHSAEIAGLAVDPPYSNMGIGAKLIDKLTEKAITEGVCRLFVLTTQTADWFLARGFREGSPSDLPTKKRTIYDGARNSRVLIKDLNHA